MPVSPVFVVVSGPPGSGKSTLAGGLAAELWLPLVAKDTIKDVLMSILPVPDGGLLGKGAKTATDAPENPG